MNINFENLKNVIEHGYLTKKECDFIVKLMNRKSNPNYFTPTFSKLSEDPIETEFTKRFVEDFNGVENKAINEVYSAYLVFCEMNDHFPLKKLMLSRILKINYGVESVPRYIGTKTIRVYEKSL